MVRLGLFGFLPFVWLSLTLLRSILGRPQLVELKNGETFNGHLVSCDNFMNVILREVFQTSADGERFWKMKECYVRGNTVSTASERASRQGG